MFATKPELAGRLLQHAHDLGIRARFVAGDEVYGGLGLRRSIRERGTGYVLAVRSNYRVTLPSGRRLTVKNAVSLVKPSMWQRMRTGQATKGAKDYDWAMIEITPDDTPEGQDDGHGFLLLRRHRYTGTVSYFLCWSPGPVPLATLIKVAVTRWKIEEDQQISKQVTGLDAGQVTTWTSWHRWTAISLLAAAFLAMAAACQRALDASAGLLELIPVSVPELLRQLRGGHRHPRSPPRQGPPRRLDAMATPSPVPSPASPPALARLRRRGATGGITNYSCRNLREEGDRRVVTFGADRHSGRPELAGLSSQAGRVDAGPGGTVSASAHPPRVFQSHRFLRGLRPHRIPTSPGRRRWFPTRNR
jgi:hypothetical protein